MGLEKQAETLLKVNFAAALVAAGVTGVTIRGFFVDDEAGEKEDPKFPLVNLVCQPNYPNGYGTADRSSIVQVSIFTQMANDLKFVRLVNIYEVIRANIDASAVSNYDLSGTDFDQFDVWLDNPGEIELSDVGGKGLASISFELKLSCCYHG